MPCSRASLTIDLPSGVDLPARRTGGTRQRFRLDPVGRKECRGAPVTVGDGSGLVQEQHVDVTCDLDGLAGFGDNVGLQRPVHTGNADRRQQATDGGRDQTHQQRHQGDHVGMGAHEGCLRRQRRHHGNEYQGQRRQQHGQGKLVWCLLTAGALDQADHAIKETVARIGAHLDHDLVGQHGSAADDARAVCAGLAQYWRRFTGDGRFVDTGKPLYHLAVGRDRFAGRYAYAITLAQLRGRHVFFLTILAQPPRLQLSPGRTQAHGLAAASRFGDGFGEVGEQHRDQQDQGYGQLEAERFAVPQGCQRECRADHGAHHHGEDDRVASRVSRCQLAHAVEQGFARRGPVKCRRCGNMCCFG